jgi:hypothetical protein
MCQKDEINRFLIKVKNRTQTKLSNFFFIQKLPKLPVPNVERTLSRYLDAIRAFIPESDFQKSEKIVQNFLDNKKDVEAIEAKLRQRAEDVENWVKKFLFVLIAMLFFQ